MGQTATNDPRVQLLIAEWYAPCREAERIWGEAAARNGVTLAVLDVDRPEGAALARDKKLRALPALIVDGELVAVGVPGLEQAEEILAAMISAP